MPLLSDPRHEAFAQGLAKGVTADKAYEAAGYKPHRGNASTLRSNQNIQARVAELQALAAEKVVKSSAFDAVSMFNQLDDLILKAVAGEDFKAAMDGMKFKLRCFGYEDSPTLTHEHVNGKSIPVTKPHEEGDEKPESRDNSQVTSFADAVKKLKRLAG